MKTRIVVLASCLLAFVAQAQEVRKELWMWKDANGVIHYSDVPGPGAKKVDLTVIEAQPRPATPAAAAKSGSPDSSTAVEPVSYTSLEILQPENEASFFDADATVQVSIRSDPDLAEGDRMVLYLDGQVVDGPGSAFEYTLSNLDRGAHQLAARIVDSRGREKIRSKDVTFYIKQVANVPPRAVGPNLKPPPRPTPRGG
jgi:hypothetical protein